MPVSEEMPRRTPRTTDTTRMIGGTVWSAMNGAELRELIGAVVERVEFDAERGSVRLAFHDLGIRALSEVAA